MARLRAILGDEAYKGESMSRVPDVPPETFTADQKRIFDAIAGPRQGVVRGPFAIWMRLPEIAENANHFGNALRLNGKLDRRLFELAILVVARRWTAQYEWFAHEPAAREAGVPEAVIDAIRSGRPPAFDREDESFVYDVVTELNTTTTVSEKSYERGIATLGLDLFIELITTVGFYALVAMVLNTFDAPVPGNAKPLPSLN